MRHRGVVGVVVVEVRIEGGDFGAQTYAEICCFTANPHQPKEDYGKKPPEPLTIAPANRLRGTSHRQ